MITWMVGMSVFGLMDGLLADAMSEMMMFSLGTYPWNYLGKAKKWI